MLNRIQSNNLIQFKIYFHYKSISQKSLDILKKQYTCCGHIQNNEQNSKATHKNAPPLLHQKIGHQNVTKPFWLQKRSHQTVTEPFYHKKGCSNETQPLWSLKRVHSTHSDQHRQKAVIETSEPSVIDKLRFEKIIPIEKEDRKLWDIIDPYVKLARWDKPIGKLIKLKHLTHYLSGHQSHRI